MRAFTAILISICVLGCQPQIDDSQTAGSLKRFLVLENPSDQQALSDIYFSMIEIDQNIEEDPNYDISVIDTWRDKVDQILNTREMKPFLSDARLDGVEVGDFDMLARSIWFPEDFRFTAKDKKLLRLLKTAAMN